MSESNIFPNISRSSVTHTSDDKFPDAFTLRNGNGLSLTVIPFGATVTRLQVPVKGEMLDVVLGLESLADYIASFDLPAAPYLGATIGRYAGRIAGARFSIGDEVFPLQANNGGNSLHGGNPGLSRKTWKVKSVRDTADPAITLACFSADGEDGFPGNLQVELTYALTEENILDIAYRATTDKDTVLNLTHHSYFNLAGHHGDVLSQKMQINAARALETDPENIPTGRIFSVSGTRFDFRTPKNCPAKIDNTFVVDAPDAATLFNPENGLRMRVETDQPGIHAYVGGNCFGQVAGKNRARYHETSGICFEAQHFPDAPNHAHFPSPVLKAGEIYHQNTRYRFDIP
jgi:aldose 1-epimerase